MIGLCVCADYIEIGKNRDLIYNAFVMKFMKNNSANRNKSYGDLM